MLIQHRAPRRPSNFSSSFFSFFFSLCFSRWSPWSDKCSTFTGTLQLEWRFQWYRDRQTARERAWERNWMKIKRELESAPHFLSLSVHQRKKWKLGVKWLFRLSDPGSNVAVLHININYQQEISGTCVCYGFVREHAEADKSHETFIWPPLKKWRQTESCADDEECINTVFGASDLYKNKRAHGFFLNNMSEQVKVCIHYFIGNKNSWWSSKPRNDWNRRSRTFYWVDPPVDSSDGSSSNFSSVRDFSQKRKINQTQIKLISNCNKTKTRLSS